MLAACVAACQTPRLSAQARRRPNAVTVPGGWALAGGPAARVARVPLRRTDPMKSLALKLSVFVLLPAPLLVGLLWAFETSPSRDQWHPLYRQQRAFLEGSADLRFLVIGNSRARNGVEVDRLGGAFSLASPGESFVETHGHLRYALEHTDKRIGAVILPIGLGSLKPMGFRRGHYWVHLVDYWEIGLRNGQPLRYAAAWLEDRLLPYRFLVGQSLARILGHSGAGPGEGEADADADARLAALDPAARERQLAAHLSFITRAGLLDGAALDALDDMLALLAEHGVQGVFVKFPIGTPLLDALHDLADAQGYPQAAIDARIAASPSAHLLDYQGLFAGRDALFSDLNHLNAQGRRLLTERLVCDLQDLGMPAGVGDAEPCPSAHGQPLHNPSASAPGASGPLPWSALLPQPSETTLP